MVDQQLNLAWDKFEAFTSRSFRHLLGDEDLSDMTLVTADDQHIKAHKVILSSASSYFKTVIQTNPGISRYLVNNIAYKDLQMIIKFIYQGQCVVGEKEFDAFLAAGKFLEVEGLLEDARPINITLIDEEKFNTITSTNDLH